MSDNPQEPHGTNTDPEKGLTEAQIRHAFTAITEFMVSGEPVFMLSPVYSFIYAPTEPTNKPTFESDVIFEGFGVTDDGQNAVAFRDTKTGEQIVLIPVKDEETDTD